MCPDAAQSFLLTILTKKFTLYHQFLFSLLIHVLKKFLYHLLIEQCFDVEFCKFR